jgi:hypothetical protein
VGNSASTSVEEFFRAVGISKKIPFETRWLLSVNRGMVIA